MGTQDFLRFIEAAPRDLFGATMTDRFRQANRCQGGVHNRLERNRARASLFYGTHKSRAFGTVALVVAEVRFHFLFLPVTPKLQGAEVLKHRDTTATEHFNAFLAHGLIA